MLEGFIETEDREWRQHKIGQDLLLSFCQIKACGEKKTNQKVI